MTLCDMAFTPALDWLVTRDVKKFLDVHECWQVIVALLFGYFIAAVPKYDGKSYISLDNIHSARSITFLWVHTFNIGFYWPAIMPFLVGEFLQSANVITDVQGCCVFCTAHTNADLLTTPCMMQDLQSLPWKPLVSCCS